MTKTTDTSMNKRASAYVWAENRIQRVPELPRPIGRLVAVIRTFWRAVSLGLLDTENLTEVTRSSYMSESEFASEDFNVDQGLWPWEAEVLRDQLHGCRACAGCRGRWRP